MGRTGVMACLWDSSVQEDRAQKLDLRTLWGNRIQESIDQQGCAVHSHYNKTLHHTAEEGMIPQDNKILQRRFTEV